MRHSVPSTWIAFAALFVLAGCGPRSLLTFSRPWTPPSQALLPDRCPFPSHPAWQVLDVDDSDQAVLGLLSDTCQQGDLRVTGARLSLRRNGKLLRQWDLDSSAFPESPDSTPVPWNLLRLDTRSDTVLEVCISRPWRCASLPLREADR